MVDSGIDTGHPDLDDIVLAGWSDFISSKTEPYDDNGHGTSDGRNLSRRWWTYLASQEVSTFTLPRHFLSNDGEGNDAYSCRGHRLVRITTECRHHLAVTGRQCIGLLDYTWEML
jgi:hypothetical protein